MKTVFLSSAYLAPVEYYSKLVTYDKVFIEQHDHYMKQTVIVVLLPVRMVILHFLSLL